MLNTAPDTHKSDDRAAVPAGTEQATTWSGKALRAESPRLIGPTAEVEAFTRLMNERTAFLVDTVKRWWDGGFGRAEGEDPRLAGEMKTFTAVALENVQASFLVRVFTHLSRGTLWQSATGVIKGDAREKPSEGPLEKAMLKGEQSQVERFKAYLSVVDRAASGDGSFLPLGFLEKWHAELGGKWTAIIIDDAAQYLRHHVKLLDRHEALEKDRLAALGKFESSARGKKYLEFREKFAPQGLPRSRDERFQILATQDAASWQKKSVKLVPAKDIKSLLKNNPDINDLVRADMDYRWLKKPNTPPSWTPLSQDNVRWPFIPASLFHENLQKSGKNFTATIDLPVADKNGITFIRTELEFAGTERLRKMEPAENRWAYKWPDNISDKASDITIKGLRLERSGGRWTARFSYEKKLEAQNEHLAAISKSLIDRRPPRLNPGDMVCVFALETSVNSSAPKRAGWFSVLGVTEDGAQVLNNSPLAAGSSQSQNNRALRRGHATWWGAGPGEKRKASHPSVHGPTITATLPQMIDRDAALKRAVRLLKLIKDPERREDAIEWLENRRRHLKPGAGSDRIARLIATLESGEPPSRLQLKPYKEEIRALRAGLQGLKENFRHNVATEILRQVHSVRTGKTNGAVHNFQERHGYGGQVVLVIEYHKGSGPGSYKMKAQNRTLSVLGTARIHELIEEKAAFMASPVPVFKCSAAPQAARQEKSGQPALQLRAQNLLNNFINPPPKRGA